MNAQAVVATMKSIVLSGLRFVAFFVASALVVAVAFEGGNSG